MAQSLKIFCLVNGESTSRAFSLSIPTTADIDDLKDLIKSKKTPEFDDIAADKFTVWKVSIAVIAASKHDVITLGSLKIKEELLPTDELSDVFGKEPLPRQTIHIIVQRLSAAAMYDRVQTALLPRRRTKSESLTSEELKRQKMDSGKL
ncbi:hypothetical protein EDD21DRAFT_355297 [Dissophora ornata]|nr:hypothetical protein EDD21DRAFT_355297 [Dissophora ornata]